MKEKRRKSNFKGRCLTIPFTEDMILYIKITKIPTKALLQLINKCTKVTGYKISMQKSIVILYSNNKSSAKRFQENLIYDSCKNIKYLKIKLTKHGKSCTLKTINID